MKQHVAGCGVGMTAFNQALDQGDHLWHMVGGVRFNHRRQGIERRHVLPVGRGKAFGQHADRLAIGLRRSIDLVIDIGDVAGVDHLRVMP